MGVWLTYRFPDPWAGNGYIDDYLSEEQRRSVLSFLEDETTRAGDAESYRAEGKIEASFERWDMVFYKRFPTYG